MGVVVVSGTRAGVGVTTVTAAVAALATGRVAVVKIAQTGCGPGDAGDLDRIARLTWVEQRVEFARYADALLPWQAARAARVPGVPFAATVRRIDDLAGEVDTVVVDGTAGPLTRFDEDGWTLLDLAGDLRAPVLLVAPAGSLDVSAAAAELWRDQELLAGVVVGCWPEAPTPAQRWTLLDLQTLAPRRDLAGVLGAGAADGPRFRDRARAGMTAAWGGRLDSAAFVIANLP